MTVSLPIESEGVKALLPHRSPMLFIDRVISFTETSIHAQVEANADWDLFNGHFPDRPILPGVILIEMIAQGGALIGALNGLIVEDTFLAFSGVDKARFKRPVSPGDVIDLTVEITAHRRGFYKFSGEASVDGVNVARVDFSATQMQFEA